MLSTAVFREKMLSSGYSEDEVDRLVSATRIWAKSDEANHDYAYPSLIAMRLEAISVRAGSWSKEQIMRWYANP